MEALVRPFAWVVGIAMALIYGLYALRWVVYHVELWWYVHGPLVIWFCMMTGWFCVVIGALGVVGVAVAHKVADWWEVEETKAQRRSTLRQLGRLHQQTAQAINQTGTGQPSGKPTVRGQIIP